MATIYYLKVEVMLDFEVVIPRGKQNMTQIRDHELNLVIS